MNVGLARTGPAFASHAKSRNSQRAVQPGPWRISVAAKHNGHLLRLRAETQGRSSCALTSFAWLFAAGALILASTATAQNAVRISEIHYDNASTDTGEAIEVSAPAGTDLTGWQIVLYNGTGGASSTPTLERRDAAPRAATAACLSSTIRRTECRTARRTASRSSTTRARSSNSSLTKASSPPPTDRQTA